MWKALGLLIILIGTAISLTFFKQGTSSPSTPPPSISQPSSSPTTKDTLKVEVIAKNLEVPWSLAFIPDGSIIFTERRGLIKLLDKNGVREIGKIQVSQNGESGLHGIAIDPDYNQNHFVYIYYTYSANSVNSLNKVSRSFFDGTSIKDEQVILDKIPAAIFHDGGRIKFSADGYLYITTGDALNPSLAQDKNALAGKILRYKNGQTEVYSYGHRNPQGITWDNQGRLWETEHGNSATDEVNLIEQGKNYGWPIIVGDQTKDGMVTPKIQSSTKKTWAPAGVAFINGSLFFGGLRGQALFELKLDTLQLKEHFKGEFGRIRDVVLGPDKMLYITTSNKDGRGNPSSDDDRIIRINPEKLES